MKDSIHIIHVEDCKADSELVHRLLQKEGFDCTSWRVQTREELERALESLPCDLILSDSTMPHFSGLEALENSKKRKPEVPFIFVSGTIGEKMGIDSLQHGATDYVIKNEMWRLVPAVRRGLAEALLRAEREVMEEELRKSRNMDAVVTKAGGLVHDFRNLLQVLKLNIALLPDCISEPERLLQLAQRLDKATDRGCEMTRDFLALARATEATLMPVDFAEQIKATVDLILPSLPSTVEMHLGFSADLPLALADSSGRTSILYPG